MLSLPSHDEVLCLQARREVRSACILIGVMRYLYEVMHGSVEKKEESVFGTGNSVSERALNLFNEGTTALYLAHSIWSTQPLCEECRQRVVADLRISVISLSRLALSNHDEFIRTLERCL